ncbi:unnamed protein product [Danaus chrysippus]|uniref:(African queen) hypothetical protein n=1 Tax=Danaus chrysippus TaxID=151541 RepID=A0A8J2QKT8_9NEOP|nr:unnamed protein product [Danaus chrysippus]
MPRHCDEDSGRSSCSATSVTFSPVIDYHKFDTMKTGKAQDSSELKVSTHPRNFINTFKSPNEKEPFPKLQTTKESKESSF